MAYIRDHSQRQPPSPRRPAIQAQRSSPSFPFLPFSRPAIPAIPHAIQSTPQHLPEVLLELGRKRDYAYLMSADDCLARTFHALVTAQLRHPVGEE